MKAFISTLLAFDPKQRNLVGGALGVVKGYYGCVEAQGRGTLHCHMLVWVKGGLNPNEIRDGIIRDHDVEFQQRLLSFLDDTISNSIPPDPDPNLSVPASKHHACSVRGADFNLPTDHFVRARRKDMHHLVQRSQQHTHTRTCYKYCKPPQKMVCRFDLDPGNVRPESTVNPETGELCLRCLDGMVNNFNDTMLEAIRCNMDIKFIGSGASAKAILYYITDYITKSQLKTHVAYAALELAVRKLGDYNSNEDEATTRAKCMLQKCAHAMISHQELSAQQVCSYLMDFEDHFTSHLYKNLYWTSFEAFIDDSPDEEVNMAQVQSEGNPEEVSIGVNAQGKLIATCSQVLDYELRGDSFSHVCLWDHTAQVEKVVKKHSKVNDERDKEDAICDNDVLDPAIEVKSLTNEGKTPRTNVTTISMAKLC
ncbi:hypothetical protein JAAARDRAFT_60799 [Jaapia argillacea MUCL 33604]|uniref:Helitron helicase-like domain-containing protein n=1 Tax=Jaapia argillacea MUCL 33604 TaxID=933084 RepID=A0A067PT28_9AGAM|nr:hypothetical protein JAAARDRAFT_60799 [Jaapia argillacea MUCL 33604]